MKISVGISNRHVHLKKEDMEILFGKNYTLNKLKDLKQPGQFASDAILTIVGPKGEIDKVRVLGPIRPYTQVEVSKTDAYKLGLNPPVRDSGDLDGSSPITLIGPNGKIDLDKGCIIASRHIHILPEQVEKYELTDKQVVSIKITGQKSGILENVHLKVADNSYFELHLDTDDANAFLLKNDDIVDIIV